MLTLKEIELIRDQQLELKERCDPLFSEAVLQACESALAVQRCETPVDYWWTQY